jgi:hypothetical protein
MRLEWYLANEHGSDGEVLVFASIQQRCRAVDVPVRQMSFVFTRIRAFTRIQERSRAVDVSVRQGLKLLAY